MSTTTAQGRRRIAGALAALTTAALLAAPPAHAAGTTSAVCTTLFTATVAPGFTLIPGTGTVSTQGDNGLLVCAGTIDGHRVTGPGRVGVHYTYSRGSCLAHLGAGTVTFSVPTTAGTKHMTGAVTVRRVALVILAEVRFPTARIRAVGVPVPTQDTCVTSPLRRFVVSVTGVLSGA
jgi:hypothetical protein